MNIQWFELMEDYFGVLLSQRKAERWIYLLQQNDALGGNLTEQDLIDTLTWVRKQREGDKNRKIPTLEMLIGWVKWYRKEQAAARRGYNNDGSLVGQIKNEMLRAPDHVKRWDILCESALTYLETVEVDEWATRRWRDWERERDKIKVAIGEAIKKSAGVIGKTDGLPYDKTDKVSEVECPF
jgi:hypothetical protein